MSDTQEMEYTSDKWRWLCVVDLIWRRWALMICLNFGDWAPREWSVHLQLGPLLVCFGIEIIPWYERDEQAPHE